ncbi:hypothetical protein MNB_SV-4-343 [hydrothermal vent metagenome]|uniref:Uncharacterized protein n=1 Tax=hydrothermal vent metagenome TaxID=652676 RepID=A0A1W1E8T1_9ZZZZ
MIYDYNLNLEKIYGSAASLKQSYFEGGYLYVPTYDYEKDFLFDEDLKLVRVQKHKARKSKKERIDIDSFSLYYAPSKKLVVYGDSFAFKINTPDGAEVKVYNNFKPVKYMISKDKKNDYDKFKEYLENQYLIRSVLFEENKNKNSSFDEYDTIKLNQNRLSLITKDYNKAFIINKKEAYSYSDEKDDIIPNVGVMDNFFVYSMDNSIYKIDKKSLKTTKLTISQYDKIYDIKKYKKDKLLILTTERIFLIDLQKDKIIKKINI